MLPKPEKKSKLNNNLLSDSEITKESDEVIAAKKIKTKRRLILISLIATAGLSFIFWSIRGVQSFINSPKPKFSFHLNLKFPDIKFTSSNHQSSNKSSDDNLNQFLSNKNWSVIIFKNDDYENPLYKSNYSESTDLSDILTDLNKIRASENSNFTTNLPQGFLFQEKLDTSSNPYFYGNIITLPGSHLTFIIQDHSQSEDFPKNLSEFINLAYWYAISQN